MLQSMPCFWSASHARMPSQVDAICRAPQARQRRRAGPRARRRCRAGTASAAPLCTWPRAGAVQRWRAAGGSCCS